MDSLAQDGVVFEMAVAPAPWTQPSMASLFCSLDPGVHGVTDYGTAFDALYGEGRELVALDERFETLAEMLQADGYVTAGFVANPFLLPEFGFDQGFDHYDASFARNTTPGNVVNEAALAWLRRRDTSRPFFLYLHYMDVHGPYAASREQLDPLLDALEDRDDLHRLGQADLSRLGYLARVLPAHYEADRARHQRLAVYREYWAARYAAGVREIDRHAEALRDSLRHAGLWNDALVILTSDHGESLCEHGLWDHGSSLYQSELHVPLVLRWPGHLPSASRRPHPVGLLDLLPTLAQLVGATPSGPHQGTSLLPRIEGEAPRLDCTLFAEAVKADPAQKAVVRGSWKLILAVDSGRGTLFDLRSDPGEVRDRSSDRPDLRDELQGALEEQLTQDAVLGRSFTPVRRAIQAGQLERLRALGYVSD